MFSIDRSLNYGRHNIEKFLRECGDFGTVVDIGAGRGGDLLLARKVNPAARLVALECLEEYIGELRGKSIDVRRVDIERDRFPFEPASVDVFLANQILEHAKEIFWILHEVSRCLKVGGTLIVGVPNLASLHNRLLLLLGRQPTCIQNHSAHIRGYTKTDFVRLLGQGFPGGYELEDFRGSNFYPFSPALAMPLARALPSFAWGIFMRFRKTADYGRGFVEYPVKSQLETNFYLGGNGAAG